MLQDAPSPPPDPRLAVAGYASGNYVIKTHDGRTPKTKLRLAPYVAKAYAFDPAISVGPGPATQIVVTGFDPLTPELQIKAFFTAFGDVDAVLNRTDPNNGSFLGVCLVRFRDGRAARNPVKAADAAKRAEQEGTGHRIGQSHIKVQLDREGRRCSRIAHAAIARNAEQERKLLARQAPPPPAPMASADLPPNVPRGPRGPPPAPAPKRHTLASLVESEPVQPRLRRKPYLYLAHHYVPVLGTTIEHLQKRLKAFHWMQILCDSTGYYVVFDQTRRGQNEAVRCHQEANMTKFFTYILNMELRQFGDPNYQRTPSPARAEVMRQQKAEAERIKQEEAADVDVEKQCRASELDPVRAALGQMTTELRNWVLGDVKARIAGPALYDLLAPERLEPKRHKLNIPAPQTKELAPPLMLGRNAESPRAMLGAPAKFGRKVLGLPDKDRMRDRKLSRPINAFQDERRRAAPFRRNVVRGLHRQMLDLYGDEKESDDDEGRSSFTRETVEQESRNISRAPSSDIDDSDMPRSHRAKRRRIDVGWGEDSEDEGIDDRHARSLLAHLVKKDPSEMAEQELEQVVAVCPRSSPFWKKADRALQACKKARQTMEDAEDLLFPPEDQPDEVTVIPAPDEVKLLEPEPMEIDEVSLTPKKPPMKAKRKTKKQLAEEAKAAADAAAVEPPVQEMLSPSRSTPDIPTVSPDQDSAHFAVSFGEPRRTIEDDFSIVLDLDGWQHFVKDAEDLLFLRAALEPYAAAALGDVRTWAWNQKQIKALNRPDAPGVSRSETKIDGYYVPNSTGCARTEGVKKILESEKSKYLPHRIRVQKQREEREARANNPEPQTIGTGKLTVATKLAAAAAAAPTVSSRSNRANNRRLANDIKTQKQGIPGAEGDAMRFNQLKKRKKLVKFDRSAIHNWGLYAEEHISANDMIIEYVGEKVRQRIADLREARYDIQGVGSSYLFRIDDDTVIDATKMGGIARFINHSCTPNCTAKIIRVDGGKRIVIYALRDIEKGAHPPALAARGKC